MFEQIFTLSAFIWCSIGTGIGLFIAALMRANDPPCVETCPKCQGVEKVSASIDAQNKTS